MKTISLETSAGSHISGACHRAAETAKQRRVKVRFRFNDITLEATPKTSAVTLQWLYDSISGYKRAAYRQTPEYRRYAAQRRQEIADKQRRVDAAIEALPVIASTSLADTVAWLSAFIEAADDIAVKCDKKAVAETLISAGFQAHEHEGERAEWFNTRQRMGRYICGQALSYLAKGRTPHPLLRVYAQKFAAMPHA